MSGKEMEFVRDAFKSNWIAPLGPHVDAFEREFAEVISGADDGRRTRDDEHAPLHATALSSGTAALHLALRILVTGDGGRGTGLRGRRTKDDVRSNEVICSTFTFSASANAIAYEGCVPMFIDCDAKSWNMDPGLLHEELAACAKRGKLPRAVIVVDLYGQCADYDPILAACAGYGVPVIEDAAEALGATYRGQAKAKVKAKEEQTGDGGRETGEERKARGESQQLTPPGSTSTSTSTSARLAGSFGAAAAFSFNGNKVMTTGGGGMLVSHDKAVTDKARFLATQARDKAPHYQHSEIGFNYRMSNVLAAIGRGQLTVLQERVAARRRNFEFYQQALGDLPGIEFMPEASYGRSTRWLTCLTIGEAKAKAKVKVKAKAKKGSPSASISTSASAGPRSSVLRLLQALEAENIEARPLWKPMHLQPVFRGCRVRGGGVSERLFENGLCLPSGSALTEEDLERICAVVRREWCAAGQ
jgi:pyridoxal phosphate-dependent aminotransferase EpsN